MTRTLAAAIFQYSACDERPERRLQKLRDALRASRERLDVVVCPELFLSGYNVGSRVSDLSQMPDGDFAKEAATIAREYGTALIYGYPEADQDGKLFNSALCIGSDGKLLANHRKLRRPSEFECQWFAAGQGYTLFDINGYRTALLVCYDIEFPEAVRACAIAGAEIVIAPTALKQEWSFVARSLVPTRAFENGVFVLYANYCGQENGFTYLGESCIIAPDGSEIARAGSAEELLIGTLNRVTIQNARSRLAYLNDCRGLERTSIE